jgi:hypothetical protein
VAPRAIASAKRKRACQGLAVATVLFHVSPRANRDSIRLHGLDWRRMGTEHNIPGAHGAEQDGVFLSRNRDEALWFVDMGRRLHRELDVWEVTLAHDFDPLVSRVIS